MTADARTLRKLTWFERRRLIESLLWLPLTALALRLDAARTLRFFNSRPPSSRTAIDNSSHADRVAHMVAAAAQYGPYRATCLPQSLVLQYLLGRDGIQGVLRHGVRKVDGRLNAHCWIEVDGAPLIDSPDVHHHFAVLEPSPAASRWRR